MLKPFSLNTYVLIICIVLLLLVQMIGPYFVIRDFTSDNLIYYGMAREISEKGYSNYSFAYGSESRNFASVASYFYAPVFLIFREYGSITRVIQLINCLFIFFIIKFTVEYVIYKNETLSDFSKKLTYIAIPILLCFDRRVQFEIILPNSDIVVSFLIIFIIKYEYNSRYTLSNKLNFKSFPFIFVASVCKYAFFSMLVVKLYLMREKIKRNYLILIPFLFSVIVVIYSLKKSFNNYLSNLYIGYINKFLQADVFAEILNTTFNFFFTGLPSCLIPNFEYINIQDLHNWNVMFNINKHFPVYTYFFFLVGFFISISIIKGFCVLFRNSKFECLTLIICLPIFIIIKDGLSRYMLPFNFVIWAAFIKGILIYSDKYNLKLDLRKSILSFVLISFFQFHSIYVRTRNANPLDFILKTGEGYEHFAKYLSNYGQDAIFVYYNVHAFNSSTWGEVSSHKTFDVSLLKQQLDEGKKAFLPISCDSRGCEEIDSLSQSLFNNLADQGFTNHILLFNFVGTYGRYYLYSIY